MWILSFFTSLMSYIINIILVIGVLATILGFVLRGYWFEQYRLICQIVGIVALSFGLYLKGGNVVEKEWQLKVEKLQAQVEYAEKLSEKYNTELEAERKKKQQVIHDTKIIVKEKIKQKSKQIDAKCVVAPEAIQILNEAVDKPKGEKK